MTWVSLLEIIYPVGSIYTSTFSTSPSEIVGGTWSAVTGALRGVTSGAGANSGSDTCTLTTSQMPSHTHSPNKATDSTGYAYHFTLNKNLSSASTARTYTTMVSGANYMLLTANKTASDYGSDDICGAATTASTGGLFSLHCSEVLQCVYVGTDSLKIGW